MGGVSPSRTEDKLIPMEDEEVSNLPWYRIRSKRARVYRLGLHLFSRDNSRHVGSKCSFPFSFPPRPHFRHPTSSCSHFAVARSLFFNLFSLRQPARVFRCELPLVIRASNHFAPPRDSLASVHPVAMGSSPENNPAAPPSAPAHQPVDEPASYNPSTKSPSELENGHGVPSSAGGREPELKDAKVADSTSIRAGDGSLAGNDLLAGEETNTILARKMHLLNDVCSRLQLALDHGTNRDPRRPLTRLDGPTST